MRPAVQQQVPTGFETQAARRRRRLNSFRSPFRLDVARLTLNWPAVEDLADSFPALLFALSTGYGTAEEREIAFHSIEIGHPLKDIAADLGLPLWLRRIPPEAFQQPLPPLPGDGEFSNAIVARIPANPVECTIWFDRVLSAYRLLGRDVAVWVAREPRLMPPGTGEEELQWLFAWIWASFNPKTPGHRLLRAGWSQTLGWKRAQDELSIWRKRISLISALAGPPRDPWFENGQALGYDILQLRTVEDFIVESADMENCLDQYATHLSYGRIRVFSVRRNGRPVADFELTLRADEITMPSVAQVRGPRNRRASPAVWQAIHAWLGAQTFRPLAPTPTPPAAAREALREFWSPYVAAVEKAGLGERLANTSMMAGGRKVRPRTRAQSMTSAVRELFATQGFRRHSDDGTSG